jgi:hypothetical protein
MADPVDTEFSLMLSSDRTLSDDDKRKVEEVKKNAKLEREKAEKAAADEETRCIADATRVAEEEMALQVESLKENFVSKREALEEKMRAEVCISQQLPAQSLIRNTIRLTN